MLTEEVIQRVQSAYSKGVQSRSSRLTPRHIYSCLLSARTLLLQQKANKRQHISQWNYQPLPCIPLMDAPLHECPCAPDGVTMLRSKDPLPKMVTGLSGDLILMVTTLDGSIRFDEKNPDTFIFTRGKKYTSNKPFFFIKNGYLFLGLVKRIKSVTLTALFHDPYEVYTYPTECEDCDNCKCKSPFEIDFHLDGDLLKTVVEMASQEAIYLFKQMSEDKMANSSDDDGQGGMVHKAE